MNPTSIARILALAISLLASAAFGSSEPANPRVYVVGVAGAG